jgi:hypothetical protein
MLNKEIRAIKLIGGEIIMGFCTEKKLSNKILIEEAQELLVQIVDGKMEVELAPWLPFAMEYNFEVNKSSIITIFKVRPNLEINYKKNTGNK